MKNTIKLSAVVFATISGLLISNHVLASEVAKNGAEITVTEPTVEVTKSEDSIAYLIQGVVVLGLAWIGYLFLKEKGNEI